MKRQTLSRLLILVGILAIAYFLYRSASREGPDSKPLSDPKLTPEITGADIDGQPFKLSDYRGKVVVLDFWGFW
jgi:cytochrome oxidase Cu insertion factor (SCO1/SenC/PrrC family)